jgi:dATP pyrophosphohydrolase
MPNKIPVSVLVLIHTPVLEVLLIERADHPDFWQSVTGSQDPGETLRETAAREVAEETGIPVAPDDLDDWQVQNRYEIYPFFRHRYPPGVTHNTEHVFGLWLPSRRPVTLAPNEHVAFEWMPWESAAERVRSGSNRDAIRLLPEMVRRFPPRG